jgi:nicotinate-nucleotide adenylyltransferase
VRTREHTRRVGILGGTFDPIHVGHLEIGDAAIRALDLARIFVIASNVPPHRPQPRASSFHRFAMVSLAVAGRPGWRASDLELRLPAPSYTSATLKRFRERGYAPCELFFIIGADAFADIASWRDYPAILNEAHFVVVSRPGAPLDRMKHHQLPWLAKRMVEPPMDDLAQMDPSIILLDEKTSDVSSTAIRERCADGLSIGGMVPSAVQQHIEQHGLYTAMTPGRRRSDEPPAPQAGRLHGQN